MSSRRRGGSAYLARASRLSRGPCPPSRGGRREAACERRSPSLGIYAWLILQGRVPSRTSVRLDLGVLAGTHVPPCPSASGGAEGIELELEGLLLGRDPR